MVRVVPFKAYRYVESKVGRYDNVVAPPYDVIKGNRVDELQARSPYNIAWITKNKPQNDDTDSNNQYTRARDLLLRWIEEGVLAQDPQESFYVYGQDFEIDGMKFFRYGFIGLIHLEELLSQPPVSAGNVQFTGVLQHEQTLPKDILDRLSLCRTTMTQFGLIFLIYPDRKGEIDAILKKAMQKRPAIDILDDEAVRHRIWIIDDKAETENITRLMAHRYVIIADGHHRYKTALQLSKENPKLESAKYRMAAFVDMANPGLVILPTHRVVQNLPEFDRARLLTRLSENFEIEVSDNVDDMFRLMRQHFDRNEHSFGLFVNDSKFYILTLKDPRMMNKILPACSEDLRSLDVSILHSLVLERILGIDKEKLEQGTMRGEGFVIYIKGIGDAVDEAISLVKAGAQAVFFMNPTRIGDVEAVSTKFEVMPQKSTFFHPKVWDGFTMNRLQ